MRFSVSALLLCLMFSPFGWAADQSAPVADGAVTLKLGSTSDSAAPASGKADAPAKRVADSEPAAPKFSDAQLSRVSGWMRELAPAGPPAAVAAAAQHFLEELQWQQPDQLERLLTDSVSANDFKSMLLRHLAVSLTAAPQAALREELARQRVQVLLAHGTAVPPPDAAALLEKLKSNSPVYYHQLIEGHIEDEDLVPLLTEAGQAGPASAQPAKPAVLTAADILAEFSSHNQTGLALEHLRAYKMEGTLHLPDGKEQHLLLFKLRPDRFRLHVMVGDTTQYILSDDGTQFWQQARRGRLQMVSRESLGARVYLAEFVNPLFGEMEDYTFKRIEDGTQDNRKVYRIGVLRPDGSRYVSCIDPETYHEVGEEFAGGIRVRNSDFREVAGITVAFREETSDAQGHQDVFELTQFTANPGLIQEFFETVPGHDLNYFAFEALATNAASANASASPATSTDASATSLKNN
jgi:hypothetical protein